LGVSDEDELGVWAPGIERVHGTSDRCNSPDNGVGIADATTGGLSTTGGVVDSLGGGSGVGIEDQVGDHRCGAIACRCSGFTSTKDVDIGAALAWLKHESGAKSAADNE